LELSQPTISYHLKILGHAGISPVTSAAPAPITPSRPPPSTRCPPCWARPPSDCTA